MIGWVLRILPIAVLVWAIRDGALTGSRSFTAAKNLVTTLQVRYELSGMAQAIVNEWKTLSVPVPSPGQFPAWARGAFQHRDGRPGDVDLWGNSYRIVNLEDGFTVSSDGPDGVPATDDDVATTVEGLRAMPR